MAFASDKEALDALRGKHADLTAEIRKVIVGQEEVVEQVLVSVFSGGHCLLVGVPGLAKTLLVNTIAQALGLSFNRIQFTPDLMPSDIIGSEILDEQRRFQFNKGPLFANIILADEINRTPPKTQSALLEAMQERAVTAAGQRHELPHPFFVLATQNPIEQEGTYPLPEAQMDRFLMHVNIDYPPVDDEVKIIELVRGEEIAAGDAAAEESAESPVEASPQRIPQEAVFAAPPPADRLYVDVTTTPPPGAVDTGAGLPSEPATPPPADTPPPPPPEIARAPMPSPDPLLRPPEPRAAPVQGGAARRGAAHDGPDVGRRFEHYGGGAPVHKSTPSSRRRVDDAPRAFDVRAGKPRPVPRPLVQPHDPRPGHGPHAPLRPEEARRGPGHGGRGETVRRDLGRSDVRRGGTSAPGDKLQVGRRGELQPGRFQAGDRRVR